MTPHSPRALSYDPGIFEHCGPLQVHAVFSRAWHLRSIARQMVSVVASSWNGPLTVCVSGLPRVTAGSVATLRETGLEVGETVFSFDYAEQWMAQAERSRRLDPSVLRHDLEVLRRQVRVAGRGGLTEAQGDLWADTDRRRRQLTGSATRDDATDAWLVRGRRELASLGEALIHEDSDRTGRHAIGLLGLGPGLTPAGDDVLCGLLAGLSVLGRRSIGHEKRCAGALAALADCIVAEAPRRTTSFSSTLLHAATRGIATEPLLQVLETVGSSTGPRGIDEVLMLGHSSGSDMLTGALLAGATLVRWEELFGPAVVGSR